MSQSADSLPKTMNTPDRVYYETGVLLNADDFRTEQDYHRARLARALAFVAGSGTVAGLKVTHEPSGDPGAEEANGTENEAQLKIAPGLAIDPIGRLIEVPCPHCIRIDRWYNEQNADDLRQGWNGPAVAWGGSIAGVTVDMHLKFVPCEHGKTPSFTTGPFDSLDAVAPARVRDGFAAELIINTEKPPAPPPNPWHDFSTIQDAAERNKLLRDAIFAAWPEAGKAFPSSVFIARIVIAATEPVGDTRPQRTEDRTVAINNRMRPFVYSIQALARFIGIDSSTGGE